MGFIYDILLRRLRTGSTGGGPPDPHTHGISDITDLENPLQHKGIISAPADFPTGAAVDGAWLFRIAADVTDSDGSKTNTGQTFFAGEQIFWNGTDWTVLGAPANDQWPLMAGRDSVATTNVYLRGPDGVPTNLSGFIIPVDSTIFAIGAGTDGADTWVAEIRKNGAAAVIASLSMTAEAKKFTDTLDVDVSAGDEIQMYCSGTNVNRPTMLVLLRRR